MLDLTTNLKHWTVMAVFYGRAARAKLMLHIDWMHNLLREPIYPLCLANDPESMQSLR
jgi:hypothetical protein